MNYEIKYEEDDFLCFAKKIYLVTGIVLSPNKKTMLYSRLYPRIRMLGMKSFSEYFSFISKSEKESGEEFSLFISCVTTSVTSFFREAHHFDTLGSYISFIANKNSQLYEKDTIRIWSAGCSTGQEPYGIAFVLEDYLENCDITNYRILATDIDCKALSFAKEGLYDRRDLVNIPDVYRKNIIKNKNGFLISDNIKKNIFFNELNLWEKWPMHHEMDAIFCRNVAIYFAKIHRIDLFNRFVSALKVGGLLFVGHSEIVSHPNLVRCGRTVYRRRA